MLKSLYIKNFTIIDELEITFDKGFNIITGETGSGKSIMIDAIDLAFGSRASKEVIKSGASKAIIELTVLLNKDFNKTILEENEIELDSDELIISREIGSSTKSRVNGVLVSQVFVQSLRKSIIDIHSQHQTYAYLQPKTHIHLLDAYGNTNHQMLVEEFKNKYIEFKNINDELNSLSEQSNDFEQRRDFLEFQINEIDSAEITDVEEYNNLVEERDVLINAEEIKDLTYSSYSALYGQDGSILDVLSSIENKLLKACEYDKNLSEIVDVIATSNINLKEASADIRAYAEDVEVNEQRLCEVDERIALLDKIKRKYTSNLSEDLSAVIEKRDELQKELNEISFGTDRLETLKSDVVKVEKEMKSVAAELSCSRKKLAEELSSLIKQELVKLEMPKAKFKVNIDSLERINSLGIDDVEFLISSNAGETLKPLAKVASGGEVSRVMLAIKTIFAKADNINTVIFDEIDTGISGKTSQAVAEELAMLSKTHQVLSITHQPIIAAMADTYFYVEKIQEEDRTSTNIKKLNQEEIIVAISKLASGSDSEDSMKFAQKLVEQSQSFKQAV